MSLPVPNEPPGVLVVDDDDQDRVLLSTVLRREGYRAIGAASAADARVLLSEREFALVVCDVRMPGESGVSLARHVAESYPGTAVLVVSGSADWSTAEAVERLAPLLVKPFSVDQFLLKVAGTLVRHEQDRTRRGHARSLEAAVEAHSVALERSEGRSRELLAELLEAEDRERRRIAADLHDDTLQVLAAAMLRLDRVASRLRHDERALGDIGDIRRELSDAADRARLMLFALHPLDLDDHGLSVAIPALVERIAAEAGVEWEVEAAVGRYPSAVEQLVFRTVAEALANVRKHSQATRVAVVVRSDGSGVCGSVIDDGVGFDLDRVRRHRDPLHFGLHTLSRRIGAAGGHLWVETGPGEGTELRFAIPADPAS